MEATIIYPHQLFAAHPGVAKGRPIFLIEDPLFFGTDPRWPLTLHGQKLVLHKPVSGGPSGRVHLLK